MPKILTSDIPTGQYARLAGLIDMALPSCRWSKMFKMNIATVGLEAAYAMWLNAPIINTFILPQVEALVQEIKNDYAQRQAP